MYSHSRTVPYGFPIPGPSVTPTHEAALGDAAAEGSYSGRPRWRGAGRPDRGRGPCAPRPGEAEVAPRPGKPGHTRQLLRDPRAGNALRPRKASPRGANPRRRRETRVSAEPAPPRAPPSPNLGRDASPQLRPRGAALPPCSPRGAENASRIRAPAQQVLRVAARLRKRGAGATGWEKKSRTLWAHFLRRDLPT